MPQIVLGAATLSHAPAVVAELCPGLRRIMLICDAAVRDHEAIRAFASRMVDAGHQVVVEAIAGEPTLHDVDRGVRAAQKMRADTVFAIGGGSAIDLAKLIAAVGARLEPAAHYALGKNPLPEGLPVFAVPTTAGTGAEMTRTAVASDREGRKLWFHGDALKPRCVLLDPQLTVGLPATVTATTGLDALVHAIEAATNINAFPANTFYALQAARLVRDNLPRTVVSPGDVAAREAMLLAACWAGIAIDNAGCAIAHGIGHALASFATVPHGHAVSIGLLATLPATIGHPAVKEEGTFVELAKLFGAREPAGLPAGLDTFVRGLGVDPSVAGFGISSGDARPLAGVMLEQQNVFGFEGAGLAADMETALSIAKLVVEHR